MARPQTRIMRGALAGAAAAGLWGFQEPLDKRVFRVPYSDPGLLGTAVARGRAATAAGWAMHLANGAAFGALYAAVRPSLPVPPAARGPLAALAEHAATWPLTRLVPRLHPQGDAQPVLWGSRPALVQATWRHVLFGVVLGELERRLNPEPAVPAPVGGDGGLADTGAAA